MKWVLWTVQLITSAVAVADGYVVVGSSPESGCLFNLHAALSRCQSEADDDTAIHPAVAATP